VLCDRQIIEVDGLCESPHDCPAKWSAMITVYLDESGTHDPSYTVVAGFAGKRRAWEKFVPAWKAGLGKRPHLHLSSMPLIYETEREWLETLSPLPYAAGLVPVYGAVNPEDFMPLVKGTVGEVHTFGVGLCLPPIVQALIEHIPSDERIEFMFEESPLNYYIGRVMMMLAKFPGFQRYDGKSRVSKWSFVPKTETCLFEPSDYLSNHLYNWKIDQTSQRSLWTLPIAEGRRILGEQMPRNRVRALYRHLERPEFRKDISRSEIKEYRNKIRTGVTPDPWIEKFK
jgi:hypothetical protein